jgi:hypothetical protein
MAVTALFLATLIGALYFALVPNVGRDVLSVLPPAIRRWCGLNDDLNNFVLFAALAFFSFWLRSGVSTQATTEDATKARNVALGRLAALLSLVAALEIAQRWIPGRFSSSRDLFTGWGGVFSAWIASRLLEHRWG